MKNHVQRSVLGLLLLVTGFVVAPAVAETAVEAYRAMGIEPTQVLTGTVLTAQVVPGPDKQVIAVTTYLTGSKDKEDAVNVRLAVFARRQGKLYPLYQRDFGAERAGGVAHGELQVVDLDRDRVNEIVVAYDTFDDPLVEQQFGEVLVYGDSGFTTVWSGPLEYDATRDARSVPEARRDRFERELDLGATLGSRGRTLHFTKTVIAVAGERLAEPKRIQEEFPFKPSS